MLWILDTSEIKKEIAPPSWRSVRKRDKGGKGLINFHIVVSVESKAESTPHSLALHCSSNIPGICPPQGLCIYSFPATVWNDLPPVICIIPFLPSHLYTNVFISGRTFLTILLKIAIFTPELFNPILCFIFLQSIYHLLAYYTIWLFYFLY